MSPKQIAIKNGDKTYITFCRKCNEKTKHYRGGNCIECMKIYNSNLSTHWSKKGKKTVRQKFQQIKWKYGIDKDEWYWMLKEQDYQCKICKKEMSVENPPGRDICVEHDHKTDRVRGLLCKKCNLLIGLAQENVSILNSAIVYVKEVCEINVN